MDSKTADFLTKLVLEDDENDIVRFAFPNEMRKIKCSVSMLSEISPVFETMFSSRWFDSKSIVLQDDTTLSQEKTIDMNDDVNFGQYFTFKLFMQIIYRLRKVNSLSVDEATAVYFYAHKYEVKHVEGEIQEYLNDQMKSGISEKPLSVKELMDGIEFAEIYQLDEFKKKLDQVTLAFDEENPMKFFDLAKKFDLKTLAQQITDHLKYIEPKDDWVPEAMQAVIKSLQDENFKVVQKLRGARAEIKQLRRRPLISNEGRVEVIYPVPYQAVISERFSLGE